MDLLLVLHLLLQSGDVVEAVAFKAFNATAVNSATAFNVSGNQTNDGTLSVTGGTTLSNLIVTGITTLWCRFQCWICKYNMHLILVPGTNNEYHLVL